MMSESSAMRPPDQTRFWLQVAADAAKRWNLRVRDLTWLSDGGKIVFKLKTAQGDYVLRLHDSDGVDIDQLRSELRWLRHIRARSDLVVPLPVAIPGESQPEFIALIDSPGRRQQPAVAACLFAWIDGESKSAAQLTPQDVERVGAFLGALHSKAQVHEQAGLARHRLDWQGLFGQDSPYSAAAGDLKLTPGQRQIFAAVGERVRAAMGRLGRDRRTFGLIHADLLSKNLLFSPGAVAALDFEFCGWGYFLYDLAPLLWQLKGERAGDYPGLEAALWAGYTSLRPSSSQARDLLEDFVAARQLASCRWLLMNARHPRLSQLAPGLIAARCQELQGYLESGSLRRKSATL